MHLIVFVLLVWSAMAIGAEKSSMPIHSSIPEYYYHNYLVPNNCTPIEDFYYDRPFVFDPPYLVTESFEEGRTTLIMACESKGVNEVKPYKILIFSRPSDPLDAVSLAPGLGKYEKYSACSHEINRFYKPGGLRVTSEPESKSPMGSTFSSLSGNIDKTKIIIKPKTMISSIRSGGSIDYLCVDGHWYSRVTH